MMKGDEGLLVLMSKGILQTINTKFKLYGDKRIDFNDLIELIFKNNIFYIIKLYVQINISDIVLMALYSIIYKCTRNLLFFSFLGLGVA